MKRLLIIFFFLPLIGFTQPYGQEWINFDQEYFKINVPDDGLYRITQADLLNAGFPVGSVNPKHLQLFRIGQELAIHVEGESDNTFDSSDYIEFYGIKNDGELDTKLYLEPEAQPHKYYNLYADSAAYFLTYDGSTLGKRSPVLPQFTGVTPDASVKQDILSVLTNSYSHGVTVNSNSRITQFDYGEGFTGPWAIEISRPNRDLTITGIDQPNTIGSNPELEVLVVGRNDQIHNIEILYGPDVNNLVSAGTYNLTGYTTQKVLASVPWSSISPTGNLVVRLTVIDDGGDRSRASVSYAKLNYSRLTDIGSSAHTKVQTFSKPSGGNVLNFVNVLAETRVLDITNPYNIAQVQDANIDPLLFDCGFADATQPRDLVLTTTRTDFSISRASFRSISPQEHNYLIISHPRIMVNDTLDAVNDYARYRASVAGGDFDTLVVDIIMLFNQFSYGQPTPLAVYNFIEFMADQGNPKYLFIIGKGMDVTIGHHRLAVPRTYHDLIPPAGSPGADLPYGSGLGSEQYALDVPVGRLSVMTAQEVINYLNKVIEMESKPYDELWRKNLLHLSGGATLNELQQFKNYVDGLGEIAKDHYLGGEIETVAKKTTGVVEVTNVAEEVNKGVNIITFFGHSTPDIIDVDIGRVSDPEHGYENQGKYPIIMMNGCEIGNIYENQFIFGEDWMSTANKGAIGVLGHSDFGYPSILYLWSRTFYSLAYADSVYIEKSVGEIMAATGDYILEIAGPNPNYLLLAQVQQMGLQGDPAIKLFGTYTPDYEINNTSVELVGTTELGLVAEADSFAINLIIRNFGAYRNDSLEVFVRRTLPNDSIVNYDTLRYPPSRYIDTLVYNIDNRLNNVTGDNYFEVFIDPSNKIDEHNELNNSPTAPTLLHLKTSGTTNISPKPFNLQSNKTVDLVVHTSNPLMPNRGFLMELDTAGDFSSLLFPGKVVYAQHQAIWEDIQLLSQDSTVYYWRSKFEDVEPSESDQWSSGSFSSITGSSPGWAQLEYPQFITNELKGLDRNDSKRELEFLESDISIELQVHGKNSTEYTYQDTRIKIDGVNYIYFVNRWQWFTFCADNKLNIVAFNKENAAPYASIPGTQVERWSCGRSPQVINSFNGGKPLEDILDAINDGDKVVLFTTGNFDFNTLDPTIIARLEDLGADATVLGNKALGEPYIMVGQKGIGAGNSIAEIVADPSDTIATDAQTITYSGNITGIYSHGSVQTNDIGPALSWEKASVGIKTQNPNDDFSFNIYGKSLSGEESILMSDLNVTETDLSGINADQYPYIKLRVNIEDTVTQTAPQLDHLIINYEPTAEGYIIFDSINNSSSPQIELQEGEELIVKLGFVNNSTQVFPVDSLEVKYTSFNKDRRIADTLFMRIVPPAPGDTTPFLLDDISTVGKVGISDLDVTVNPVVIPEQVYSNNSLRLTDYLLVTRDESNPVLDVSFDGEYIFDGDIVSPTPSIRIEIRDENPYLFKSDTIGVDVFIKRPCDGCSAERISLSGSEINWTAQDSDNPFVIDYKPMGLSDGVYELQVQVEDASGNLSGSDPYRINFEIINESTITNFYPYPNPFSTSVKFIFTLTGHEIPDQIMIRIFTVSGRVIREITQDELGALKIGNNVTDYAWDGRDEFGDQLANGVYLYKVFIRQNGENIELRQSAGDRGFKNGYGKLYLLR